MFFFLYLFLFFIVPVLLSPFSHHHFPLFHPLHLLPSILSPFGFNHGAFIHVPWWPFFLLLSLSPLLSAYCQVVLYFNVSGCILLACVFCWLGSSYRWDHVEFLFHCLACYLLFNTTLTFLIYFSNSLQWVNYFYTSVALKMLDIKGGDHPYHTYFLSSTISKNAVCLRVKVF